MKNTENKTILDQKFIQSLNTKKQILEAARKELLSKGASALSHQGIANRLGQSKATILYHYPTKKALWEALVDDYVAHLNIEEEKAMAPFLMAGLTPGEAIIPAMIPWYRRFHLNKEGWASIGVALMGLHIHDHNLTRPIRSWYKSLYNKVYSGGFHKDNAQMITMLFVGIFVSIKLGIEALSYEDTIRMQYRAVDALFNDSPEKLKIIKKILADS